MRSEAGAAFRAARDSGFAIMPEPVFEQADLRPIPAAAIISDARRHRHAPYTFLLALAFPYQIVQPLHHDCPNV